MSGELHAWIGGEHVAVFSEDSSGIALRYDGPDAPSLSLSLRNGETWPRLAPARWLDNLLPENPHARAHIAATHDADSTSTFALLQHAGADLAGAVSLMPASQRPGEEGQQSSLVTEDQLKAAIAAVRAGHASPAPVSGARMSLAGAQGKFGLARVGDRWWTPTAALPSTHIFKPARPRFPALDRIEVDSLSLATRVGIPAAAAELRHGAFTTVRFDRRIVDDVCTRRHMEDFAQALAMPASRKYEVRAEQVIALLGRHAGEAAQLGFIERLAFNVHLGNADAHGKNFSIFLDDHTLTPLYDVVPVGLFPSVDQQLAMKLGGARFSAEVQPTHWAKLAGNTGLDADQVVHIAQSTVHAMLEHAPDSLRGAVEHASRGMTRGLGA